MLIKHHSANGPQSTANLLFFYGLLTEAPPSEVKHDYTTVRRLVFILKLMVIHLTEPSNAPCSFSTMLHALFIQCLTCHHIIKVMDQVRLDRLHFIWHARTHIVSTLFIMFNQSNYMRVPSNISFNRCGVVPLCR